MIKDIIRYVIIVLIALAIVLVMKNLVTKDNNNWQPNNKTKEKTQQLYFNASISLLDKETNDYIEGAKLKVLDKDGKIIDTWTTTKEIHTINNIKKGTYTLEEETTPEEYKTNEEKLTFKIEKTNAKVSMYNEKKTEEELQTEKEQNTSSNEINVDNTLSTKNKLITILSIITFISGIYLISYKSTRKISYFN